MKIFILMVIMGTNYGGYDHVTINFQEFGSIEQCKYAASLVVKNGKGNVQMAQCVEK